ncbi:energy-coupling factor transporter transmembrane protein EcfT [Actinotalea sp. BY-33]|uniref:Energy-coupling factor transporter transmembrane protein EcfT n=1 Tax=Actinotalea soli TaxID=2819234 RepID=A0A939RX32_9CELL|nr:energy-coupling factor transporter transmembrane component T [Actinotalea soli]MBO1752786.1 energy-coupling factor transporter transmembrane protein EcfT [Actinotalea soli]
MARKQRDVVSVEWVKLELLRTAYATRGGLLSRRDPRIVLGWYLVFAVVPWLTHNITTLAVLFGLTAVAVLVSRVGPLILGLFVIGLVLESTYLLLLAWLFDGDITTVLSLVTLTLKLGTISLASMAAFVSLDPEKLSDALISLRAPALLSFGVSYGYRMLPILMTEFHTIVNGFRLRSAPLERRGILGWRAVVRLSTTLVQAFYPMMLNTAKRTRTTVEALETRGFTFAGESPLGRDLRLAYLRVGAADVVLLAVTLVLVAAAFVTGAQVPLFAQAR